jgi:hypothetical protein
VPLDAAHAHLAGRSLAPESAFSDEGLASRSEKPADTQTGSVRSDVHLPESRAPLIGREQRNAFVALLGSNPGLGADLGDRGRSDRSRRTRRADLDLRPYGRLIHLPRSTGRP